MSKLSFRARALDATKAMPVYRSEEIPDLPDFAAINRAVPQMPTGMEKDEECETHLQRAMTAQQTYGHTGELVIPTPDVFPLEAHVHDKLYPANFKLPKQLIYVQPLLAGLDDDTPEYDLDSEDEAWLGRQNGVRDGSFKLSALQFETMIDRLEKASGGHRVVQMNEAKLLLNHDDDVLIAVYDYWLNKRLKLKSSTLTPQIKTEKRDGSNSANPYVAFRRRTEKMQTRKNRKNDEASYEKMLKLKRDLKKAVTLLEMVKKREKLKKEDLNLTVEVFRERVQAGDFSGALVAETLQELARKKQQMQLAQAREREQLLGIGLGAGGRGSAGAAGRNSNNTSNNNNNNNGYAGPAANAHQIRELKAKHRKTAQGPRISTSSSHKRQKERGTASTPDTRLTEHPSNGGAGAALLATIGREVRSVETPGRCPLTALGVTGPGVAAVTPTAAVGSVSLTAQGTPGSGGQIATADSATVNTAATTVGPLGPMLLSSDEDDDEALSSGAEERADALADMSHEPDGIFTFRRKRNVTYLAPLPFETTLAPLAGDTRSSPSPPSIRPYEQIPRQEQFHLMSVQLESDDSDLSGHEADDSARNHSHSLIPRLDEATARERALAVAPQPPDGQEFYMTFSGARARALATLPRAAGEAGVKRRRLDTNYLTLLGRRRLGRGGRIVFDRIRMSSPEASP